MINRRQLPVSSRVTASALARGLFATLAPNMGDARAIHSQINATLAQRYRARAVALLDSGTSALAAAIRIVAGPGKTIALPAFNCVDLIAAARYADVKVRLYDIVPTTLSPDLDSLSHVLADGVDAIVVAHLFGFPADVPSVRVIASKFGVPIIEDAAQHAAASLHGTRTGTLGDLSILSFGRGKGITAGNGGALLALDDRWTEPVAQLSASLTPVPRGLNDWVGAAASWILGRPSIYALPASIPSLHLGETVYHDAHAPTSLSAAGGAILKSTLAQADADAAKRTRIADALRAAAEQSTHMRACTPIPGSASGYLRFPIITDKSVAPIPRLGIVRSYPRALNEQAELRPILISAPDPLYGAHELASQLLTLPTHHMVTGGDLRQLSAWLRTA